MQLFQNLIKPTLLAFGVMYVAAVTGCSASPTSEKGQHLPVTAEVELRGQTIGLEVAQTPQEQATGLMFRQFLPDERGMLFPVEPPRPVTFWMKDTVIPLDMLFISEGEIVAILEEVPPCLREPCPSYGPETITVDAVLEVRGGLTQELGVQAGDVLDITEK